MRKEKSLWMCLVDWLPLTLLILMSEELSWLLSMITSFLDVEDDVPSGAITWIVISFFSVSVNIRRFISLSDWGLRIKGNVKSFILLIFIVLGPYSSFISKKSKKILLKKYPNKLFYVLLPSCVILRNPLVNPSNLITQIPSLSVKYDYFPFMSSLIFQLSKKKKVFKIKLLFGYLEKLKILPFRFITSILQSWMSSRWFLASMI